MSIYSAPEWDVWRCYFFGILGGSIDNLQIDTYLNSIETTGKLASVLQQHTQGNLTLDNLIKEGEDMAKLSSRVCTHHTDGNKSNNSIDNLQFVVNIAENSNKTKEENNMKTRNIRTVNLTLNDNDTNLDLKNTLVFQATLVRTEHSDEKTIQNLLMSGKVQTALEKHNDKRADTVDKSILKSTGVKVYLDPVEIWDLEWKVVAVA